MSEEALHAPASPAEMGPLLTSLRDLHEPAPVHWWPLSPAWWVLALIVIIAITWFLRRRYKRRTPIRLGKQHVMTAHSGWRQHGHDTQYLNEVNKTLRQIALTVKPRNEVAGLTGARWIATLNAMSSHKLTTQSAQALSDLAYRPDPTTSVEQLHSDLLRWINCLQIGSTHA